MSYALITGASSGIGQELAKEFIRNYDLILVARNKEKLDQLKKELQEKYSRKVIVYQKDLSQKNAAKEMNDWLLKENLVVLVLVNNAGFGRQGSFIEIDLKSQEELMQLNMVTLVELTYYLAKQMKERGQGRILNIASVAAFSSGPYMSLYYASKAFVLSFSQAINKELEGTGVTVTVMCPGPTITGFEKNANMKQAKMFHLFPQTAKSVAKAGYKATMKGKSLQYHGIVTYSYNILTRILPRKLVNQMAYKIDKGE